MQHFCIFNNWETQFLILVLLQKKYQPQNAVIGINSSKVHSLIFNYFIDFSNIFLIITSKNKYPRVIHKNFIIFFIN